MTLSNSIRTDRILRMRLAGQPVRVIAQGSSVLDPGRYRQLDQIDNKYRERTRVGEPMRLDQLHRAYYQKALQGDAAAGRLLWCGSARGARDARAR